MTGREPLTYYDMNLSAQDHQTFFTCDTDHLRPADASKQMNSCQEGNGSFRLGLTMTFVPYDQLSEASGTHYCYGMIKVLIVP